MKIERFESGLLESSMYVVTENGHAVVIDPCMNCDAAAMYIFDYIFITHEHYDHISGVNAWKAKTSAPLVCSRKCSELVCNSKKNLARHFDAFCEIQTYSNVWNPDFFDTEYVCKADLTFDNEELIEWQDHIIKLVEIPGHSLGSIGIWIDDVFFSGDSLLEGKEIELRFPGGNRRKWEDIGKRVIDSIPNGTKVYPGHFDGFILKR